MTNFMPPQGFVYDERSGFYYSQKTVTDNMGMPVQVITWFNPNTGEFTENTFPVQNNGANLYGRKRMPVWGWVLIIAGAAAVVALCIFLFWRMSLTSGMAGGWMNGLDQTSESSASENLSDDSLVYVDTTGVSPIDRSPSDYEIEFDVFNEKAIDRIKVTGMGDMSGKFLTNPPGFTDDEIIYTWEFMFTDDLGVRVYGRYNDVGHDMEPDYKDGEDFLQAMIIRKEGGSFKYKDALIVEPDTDGIELSSCWLGDFDSTINCYELSSVKVNTILANDRKVAQVSVDLKDEDGNELLSDAPEIESGSDAAEIVPEWEVEPVEGAPTTPDLHSWGMSGFRYCGGFDCTDPSLTGDYKPRLILDDDGYCELYANMGDGMYKMQGYFEYGSDTSEYADQGAEVRLYMHFPGNFGGLEYAEAIYDGEVEGGYIYFVTPGFGLMGGDDYYAGYFSRVF